MTLYCDVNSLKLHPGSVGNFHQINSRDNYYNTSILLSSCINDFFLTAARDMNKCSQVVNEITNNSTTKNTKNGNTNPGTIKCMECDLESFDSMKTFIENVVKNEPKIDTLINSAGTY